jgi:hypothetical protein
MSEAVKRSVREPAAMSKIERARYHLQQADPGNVYEVHLYNAVVALCDEIEMREQCERLSGFEGPVH